MNPKRSSKPASLAWTKYLELTEGPEDAPVALAVHETVEAQLAGSVSIVTLHESTSVLFCITAWPVDSPDRKEIFFLRRTYPFDPVASEIKAKPFGQPLHRGVNPLSFTPAASSRFGPPGPCFSSKHCRMCSRFRANCRLSSESRLGKDRRGAAHNSERKPGRRS